MDDHETIVNMYEFYRMAVAVDHVYYAFSHTLGVMSLGHTCRLLFNY